jgi:hypothetical protein
MNSGPHPRIVQRLRGLSWRRLLAGAFSVILFGYLFATLAANWQALRQYEWRVNPLYLVASMGAYILSLLLGASAWHCIVWSMDKRVSYRRGIKFFLQSNLAKRLPGLIWYAMGRLYLYEREGVAKSAVSVALILELITIAIGGLIVYTSTVWAGVAVIQALHHWWLVVPLAGLAVVSVWPQVPLGAVNWLLARRGKGPIQWHATRVDLIQWGLLQAGAWAAGGIFIYLLASGVYPELAWSYIVQVINRWAGSGLVALVTMIVPLGLGLKEVTLAYLLSELIPWPVAVLVSLLGRICSIIGDCVGLLVASRM